MIRDKAPAERGEDEPVVAHEPALPTGLGEPAKKKGRPYRGQESTFDLLGWLSEHRPGSYKELANDSGKMPFQCAICNTKVRFMRASTNHFVHNHEKAAKHSKAVSASEQAKPCLAVVPLSNCNSEAAPLPSVHFRCRPLREMQRKVGRHPTLLYITDAAR